MVQHRACTGPMASTGPSQGHYYVDHKTGRLVKSAIAYEHPQPHACFIQSRERRPGQRRRHHGFVDARGAPVQIRLRHRHQLLLPARRERAAVGRRQVVGPDELPQDRRPRRRRHQVGRHHAARRQDGDRGCRPSRHRGLHRLEGDRGAEGRRHGRRLQAGRTAPERDHEGLRQLRRPQRRLLRSARRTRRCAARSGPRANR